MQTKLPHCLKQTARPDCNQGGLFQPRAWREIRPARSESGYIMSMTLENKEYQKRSRLRRIAEGGKALTLILTPEENAALEKLKAKLGANNRDTIGKALLEAAKRIRY
jgi:hypothetical protein